MEAFHYHGLGLDAFAGQALDIGPTLYAIFGQGYFLSAAWNVQVCGAVAGSSGALDLVNFERHQVKLRPPVKLSHVAGINDVVCTWPPMTSEFPARLIEGYRDFLAGRMATERERYRELARRGQSPAVMVIGCCDSRVSPEVIFDTHPGELFVVRNIANLVPAYTPDGVCHGVFAALEFAVQVLKVRHIVVLGHARCGGIRAFVEGGPPLSPGDSIHKWMSLIAPAVELAGPPEADGDYLTRLEQASIAMSLDNLLTFPYVAEAIRGGRLFLHGAYFDVATGRMFVHDGIGYTPMKVGPVSSEFKQSLGEHGN